MKILNFDTGGRPLVNDDLQAIQDNDALRAEAWLRGLGAGAFVLEGCELTLVSGTTYNLSAGAVFIDGKIADLDQVIGLDLATTQYIWLPQDVGDDTRLHEDGQSRVAASTRKAEIVGALPVSESIALIAGQQPQNLRKVLDNASVPIGTIIMTDDVADFDLGTGLGSGTWANWALCDGQNGTPNLKGRFIAGYDGAQVDYNAVGKTGGASSVTLTINQIPAHDHRIFADEVVVGGSVVSSSNQAARTDDSGGDLEYSIKGSATAATVGRSSATGGGQSHENRPPFYVLAYVKKIS